MRLSLSKVTFRAKVNTRSYQTGKKLSKSTNFLSVWTETKQTSLGRSGGTIALDQPNNWVQVGGGGVRKFNETNTFFNII